MINHFLEQSARNRTSFILIFCDSISWIIWLTTNRHTILLVFLDQIHEIFWPTSLTLLVTLLVEADGLKKWKIVLVQILSLSRINTLEWVSSRRTINLKLCRKTAAVFFYFLANWFFQLFEKNVKLIISQLVAQYFVHVLRFMAIFLIFSLICSFWGVLEGATFHFWTTLVNCVQIYWFIQFVFVEERPRLRLKLVSRVWNDRDYLRLIIFDFEFLKSSRLLVYIWRAQPFLRKVRWRNIFIV